MERCYEAGVDTIAIGDLTNIRQKIDYSDHLNQRPHAWPFAKIADRIEYKARLRGIQVVKICEAYSSQTCHASGKIARSNRKTRGSYACSCGWHATPISIPPQSLPIRFQLFSPHKAQWGCGFPRSLVSHYQETYGLHSLDAPA